MGDITKFFQKGEKKRDLSDKPETGKNPKKIREGSLGRNQIGQASNILDNIFVGNLDSLTKLNFI